MTGKLRFNVKGTDMEVGKLRLHSGVNRQVRPGRIKQLTDRMDLDALGRFAVWHDGARNFYVIDGQHRKLALEALGLADWRVHCDIYENMTFADACEQFLKLNDGLVVRPYDKFDKGVKAGRQECVETQRIIEAAGFRTSDQARDGMLKATGAAVDVWKLDQGVALEQALRWSSNAWGHTTEAVEGTVIKGLGILSFFTNGDIDEPALVKKLSKYPGGPAALIGASRSQQQIKGGTIPRNFARIIVDLYNRGRRSGQINQI